MNDADQYEHDDADESGSEKKTKLGGTIIMVIMLMKMTKETKLTRKNVNKNDDGENHAEEESDSRGDD